MKVIFASLSAVLLGSIPGVLSAEPKLRGATLVTDFEDHATELIASMPSSIKKKLKSIKKDDDLTKKEIKSAQKSVIKSWEKRTNKNCAEYLSALTCGEAKKCVWMVDTCVATKALDAEDYDYDFITKSYNVPKKVEKKLKEIKDSDLTKKEIKSAQKKIIRKWERKTEKKCIQYLSPVTCDAVSKCVWHKDGCVSKSVFKEDLYFGADDYDFVEDPEDYGFVEDSAGYDGDSEVYVKDGEPKEVPPDNDTCSNATVISKDQLGIVQGGSVKGATLDDWQKDPNCGFLQVPPGNGVWYAIKGIDGGTNLKVTCSFMDCMLLTTNPTLGECPSMFLCADAWVGRGVSNELVYDLTTQEEGIYYVYIAPTRSFAISEYNLLVEEFSTVKPTMAPTNIVSFPANASNGNDLGTLFKLVLFAAMYFSV